MNELKNNDDLVITGPSTIRVELNTGTASLEFKKSDNTYSLFKTYPADTLEIIEAPRLGQTFRAVLTGDSKIFVG